MLKSNIYIYVGICLEMPINQEKKIDVAYIWKANMFTHTNGIMFLIKVNEI